MPSYIQKKEKLIGHLLSVISVSTLLVLIGIFVFLFVTGIKTFSEVPVKEFFLSSDWNPAAYGKPRWGILSLIVGTIMVTLGGLIIGIPLGLAGAIYLAEVASPKVRETVKPAIEMIASIPSVVLGLVGLIFLAPLVALSFGLNSGLNAFTSSIIVSIMILPTLISISEDVLTSLPREFREGSLALGATKWQTIRRNVLPHSMSGMTTGSIIGISRAIGETAPIILVGATFFIS